MRFDMKEKYQSVIMEAIHEEAQALFDAGAIDEKRMSEYNQACLIQEHEKNKKAINPVTKRIKPAAQVYASPR